MQTLVIGDIHGCYVELQALLDKAGLSDGDSIISLGDFVDRGPETPQVLEFFRQTPNARALMGNHERKHVRGARGEVNLALSQQISRQQFGDDYGQAVAWMSDLPLFLELPDALLVHGYLEPGLPLAEQKPFVLCGNRLGEKFLREHYARPWYELYRGEQPVIVGHYNYAGGDQPFIYQDKVFGLDTDCVHGRRLTGVLLPGFRFVSVPSRGNLWGQVSQAYQKKEAVPVPQPFIKWSAQDELLLVQLVEKARQAHADLLAQLPGFAEMTPDEQSARYAEKAGRGPFASLLHLARLGKLDAESARKVVKEPNAAKKLLGKDLTET
jgi:serine/threonine protein phosphatase 1